jgi:hypothetical protein
MYLNVELLDAVNSTRESPVFIVSTRDRFRIGSSDVIAIIIPII